MRIALLMVVVWLMQGPGWAGTITGSVSARGKLVPEDASAGGGYESKKFKFVEKIDWEAMHDFVVYIEGPIAGTKAPAEPRKITQRGAAFEPHVLPIMVGTTVEWPNEDDVFHNVYSKSQVKKFNLGLYKKGDKAKKLAFDQPGEVDVFCSIHANMSCIVLVLENPYFATTDSRRRYTIPNVPAGHYKLVAWQERLPDKSVEITVPETGEIKVDFVLGPDIKP